MKTLNRTVGIRKSGPLCGSEIRTALNSEIHEQGFYLKTNDRDERGRTIFLWNWKVGKEAA